MLNWEEYCRSEKIEYLGCLADPKTNEILGHFATEESGKIIRLGGKVRHLYRGAYDMPENSQITENNIHEAVKVEDNTAIIKFCQHPSDMHEVDEPYAFVIKTEKKEELQRMVDSWTGKDCWMSTGCVCITISKEQEEQAKKEAKEYVTSNKKAIFYINDTRIPEIK